MHLKLLSGLFICIVSTIGCSPRELEISDFRQGLIEFDSDRQPRIYQEGNSFPFKENGTCIADGKEYSCMWYGIEFAFKSPDEITIFNCVTTASGATTFVNPRETVARTAQANRWSFSIRGYSGRYVRPGYTIGPLLGNYAYQTGTICFVKDREVLRWDISLEPPGGAAKNAPKLPSR